MDNNHRKHEKRQQKIFDPHLHLFNLAEGSYHWLKDGNPPFWPDKNTIKRNFTPDDLSLTAPFALKGFVHIEAGFDNEKPWREIAWLASINLPETMSIKAVAFIDICADEEVFNHHLKQLLDYEIVVGCRYILDQQAAELLQQPVVINNLSALASQELCFEVQMPVADLSAVNALLKVMAKEPNLKLIINHAGFPPYFDEHTEKQAFHQQIEWQNWQQNIRLLSRFENCSIKCSGWEMANRQYSDTWVKEVLSHCFKCFGEKRLMLASNFPLTLFSKSYRQYWLELINNFERVINDHKLEESRNGLTKEDIVNAVCCENALAIYQKN